MESENKTYGLFSLTSMCVGGAIGAGIFALAGIGIGLTGRSAPYAMILAVLLYAFTYIPLLFISSAIPLKGGSYSQSAILLPKILVGVNAITLVMPFLTIAMMGISMADYLIALIPVLSKYHTLVSAVLLSVFFLVNMIGDDTVARVQNILTIIMLVALGIYIVVGLGNLEPGALSFTSPSFLTGGRAGFFAAVALLSMAGSGPEAAIQYTQATKNPKRTVPLAMVLSVAVITVVYFLICLVAGGVLPVEQVAGMSLGVSAKAFLPTPLYVFFMIGGAIFALGTSLNNTIACIKYPIIEATNDGWFPKFMGKTNKRGVPLYLFVLAYIVAMFTILTGISLANIVNFMLAGAYILSVLMVCFQFRLPKMFPEEWKKSTFHVPDAVFYVLNALSLIVSAYFAYTNLISLTPGLIVGNFVFIVLCFGYSFYRIKAKKIHMEYLQDMK